MLLSFAISNILLLTKNFLFYSILDHFEKSSWPHCHCGSASKADALQKPYSSIPTQQYSMPAESFETNLLTPFKARVSLMLRIAKKFHLLSSSFSNYKNIFLFHLQTFHCTQPPSSDSFSPTRTPTKAFGWSRDATLAIICSATLTCSNIDANWEHCACECSMAR